MAVWFLGLHGLFVFLVLSDLKPCGGGTLFVSGSHRLVNRFFRGIAPEMRRGWPKPLKQRFRPLDPWLQDLAGAIPSPNHRDEPRVMRIKALVPRTVGA